MPDTTKKCGVLYREGEVLTREDGTRAIDTEDRTVDIAFSSETPVERWFGEEILDHSPSSVRLGRLQNKGPILVDHNRTDHVGVVDSVSIDADRRGRATVRFGKGERASEVFTDVSDGIRSHVSVGYRVHEWTENKDGDTRVTDWEPMEISFVSIPADASVGVGRDADSDENEVTVHTFEEERIMPDKDPAPTVDVKKVERDAAEKARKAEQSRIREINALGTRNELGDLAAAAVDKGTSLDDFRVEVIDSLEVRRTKEAEERAANAQPATLLGMEGGEVQRYSLMRAIRAAANGNWKGAEFERECSDAVAQELGREAQGFFVPFDVQMRGSGPMQVDGGAPNLAVANIGSDLVGTDHLAGSFIDFLYTNSVVYQSGATSLPGLVGNVDIPKQAGSTAFTWLGEDDDGTDADIATATVSLTPTTVAGAVPITRRLMKQSAPSVEAMVMNDLARGAALAIDLAAVEGDGTGANPLGIVNQAGVLTQLVTGWATTVAPTWAEIVGFESALDGADALGGQLRWITTPSIIGTCKTTPRESGQATYLMDSDRRDGGASVRGSMNGYPVSARTGMTDPTLIFGNISDVLIGMWGVLDVMADTATKAASGGLVLRVFQDIDVAVRHPESFCIGSAT